MMFAEEQLQSGVEEDAGAGGAAAGVMWGSQHQRQPHSKLFPRKHVSILLHLAKHISELNGTRSLSCFSCILLDDLHLQRSATPNPGPAGAVPTQQMWVGWANPTGTGFVPQPISTQFPQPQYTQPPPQQQPNQQPTQNPYHMLRSAFPGLVRNFAYIYFLY